MKTNYTLLYVLTVLLSIFGVQVVQAQAQQDALYIFRNDGKFNAFFWGDIDHIEYSKIDTLGVEHDDYVTQEVWALDTVSRIPISAIDSVAFVTPENIIKADVLCPDASIADYIIASDTINWIKLALNTPKQFIPKEGEKFYIQERSKYIPRSFMGQVTEVKEENDGYKISTGYVEITDIFDRLVEKVAAATPGDNAHSRKRGLMDGTEIGYTTETPIEFPAFGLTIPVQGSYALLESGPFALTGDLTGSISVSAKPKYEIRAFLYVDALSGTINFDQAIHKEEDSEINASLAGSLTGHFDFPLVGGMPHPISKLLDLSLSAGLFIEGQFTGFTAGYVYKDHTSKRLHTSFRTVDGWEGNNILPTISRGNKVEVLENNWTGSLDGKIAFSTGVFGECKLLFAPLDGKTPVIDPQTGKKNTWFTLQARVDGGIKLESDVPYLNIIGSAYDLLKTQTIYTMLNQESSVNLTLFSKGAFGGSIGKYSISAGVEADIMGSDVFGIVPNITGININYDDAKPYRPYRIKAVSPIERNLLISTYTGFAVYDEDNNLVDDWCKNFWFGEKISKKKDYEHVFTTLDPAKDKEKTYTVYPEVEVNGKRILVDKSKKITLTPAQIDISQQELFVNETLGFEDVEVVPNMAIMEAKSEADWIEEPVWYPDENNLNIKYSSMPDNMQGRIGVVRLTGKNHKGEVLVEDSIVVFQGQPYIFLSTNQLKFDVKGGTQEVTITDTNVKNITVKAGNEGDYIHPSIKDNVITIKVDENPNAEGRANSVFVEGRFGNGMTVSVFISIEQDGTGETPGPGPNTGEVSVAAQQFLKSIMRITAGFRYGYWYKDDTEIRHSYSSDYDSNLTWDSSAKDKYNIVDTIMIADVNDPHDPHCGMYMISAERHVVGSRFPQYNNRDEYTTIQFYISPYTEASQGDILDATIYHKKLRTDESEYYNIQKYTIAKVPFYETRMIGDGVTNNRRDVGWMANAVKGTLKEGSSSYWYSVNAEKYEKYYEYSDYEECRISINFNNTIE